MKLLCCLTFAAMLPQTLSAQDNAVQQGPIPVTIENFLRAASDIEMAKYLPMTGGVNQFGHFRSPTPIDQQNTIRMNRDTLYSFAIIDIRGGAELTLPDAGERYISAQIVNQDHYENATFVGGGRYALDTSMFDTDYVIVVVRILVDASSKQDVETVWNLQDQMTITSASAHPFDLPDYDMEAFEGLRQAAVEIGRYVTDSSRTFGAKEEVDPLRHFLGTAVGFAGLSEQQAIYLNIEPGLPVGEYKIDVPADVPVRAFWSISLYNADGFFQQNDRAAYNVNSVMGNRNPDGSMTIFFGGCGDGRANCLPIMEGWNYTVRLYQPDQSIVDGTWTFPLAEEIQ